MMRKWSLIACCIIGLMSCGPKTGNISAGTVSVQLKGLDSAIFDDIESVVFLPFEATTQADCLSLQGATLEQMSDLDSSLEFIAARKLDTSLAGIEHPEVLLEQQEACAEETGDPDSCPVPYFRYRFGALEPGPFTLIAWGTSEPVSPDEAEYGYFSSGTMQTPDGGLSADNEKLAFLERFYPRMTAAACLQFQITAGVDLVKEMELFPVGACCDNGRCELKTYTDCDGTWHDSNCDDATICTETDTESETAP